MVVIGWNSPHQSKLRTVGQQVGLLVGGNLRQVLSEARYRQSLQVICVLKQGLVPSQAAEPVLAAADSAKDRCS